MTTGKVGMRGHPPKVLIRPIKDTPKPNKEYLVRKEDVLKILPSKHQLIYEKAWSFDEYRKYSPGENYMDLFLETAEPPEGTTVIDWGCGTGRAGFRLWQEGLDVTLVDFAANCLDDSVRTACEQEPESIRFIKHDLTRNKALPSQFGICCDVLEHIPEDKINDALDTILDNSRHVFFQIATVDDQFSEDHPDDFEEPLHLTVRDYQWWLEKFVTKKVIIHHSNDLGNRCIFYLTGWGNKKLHWDGGHINTDMEVLKGNMIENAKVDAMPIKPHEAQERELMLIGGGPSLNQFTDEIIENRKNGMLMVTMNGTYNWAHEHGLTPSMQLVIDGREFNRRFVEPINDTTKYVIASQCHPAMFEGLPPENTYMWQVTTDEGYLDTIKEHYGTIYEDWFPCPGGSTVMLRGLCMLRMLGYYKFHIYGFDSCLMGEDHHAYSQPENDKNAIVEIIVGQGTKFEKKFQCHPWMVYQAREFQMMVPRVLKDARLNVKGDGMIAYIIESNAGISQK